MTIENGTGIVLAYVLVNIGVIIAFLLAAFAIGCFICRLRQRCANRAEKSKLTGGGRALVANPADKLPVQQRR